LQTPTNIVNTNRDQTLDQHFLARGGEMGERTRAFDWSTTPLGPVAGWPQSLRSAVSFLLPSKAQIVLFWGPDLITIYNDAYRPVFGGKHPHVLGLPAREAWSELWLTGLKDLFEGVLSTGEAYWASDRPFFMERYGFLEETFFDVSYDPVRDESGRVGGLFCIVSETTTRVVGARRLKTLRELSARTQEQAKSVEEVCERAALTLAENPHDVPFALLYLLDDDGRRAALAGLTGVGRDTFPGPAVIELASADGPWPLRQVVETGRAVEVQGLSEKFGPLPGGAWPESPERAVVLPMARPGQAQPAGFVVAGVSPRLAFNDDYKGFLDLLAAHVATAVANARAYEEERRRAEALAELDRAKTAFFSNVSHEFRTPLTLMLGPVADLLAKSHSDLSPAAAGQLEVVNRNGLRLLRLVNTLLDFSRIEAGRVKATYQPTDLAAFTTDVASVFRAAIERAGLRLVVDCERLREPVFVDRDLWEKIVLNLISNAFKFTFQGEITVRVRQVGSYAELRVQDTGTGIPAVEMPRLFERFHRVQNARGRTHEGSGIGLALVLELVKLHGGTIAAESVLGQGTTFIVAVPLGSGHLPRDQIGESRALAPTGMGATPYVDEAIGWLPDENSSDDLRSELPTRFETLPIPALPPEHEQGDHRPRVLVADDNADMRHYLVRLLAERYRIEAAADGEAALATARENPPDLVLTDVMMPRLDGFGLLRELRADPRTREVPVIMLSARAGEESRIEGVEAGADDYLIKPFSARELLARVGAHLQMARMRRESGEALRESEARFRHMADHAPVMVWVTDPDGSCSYRSESWYKFTGQTPATSLGFGWLDAVHPNDRTYAHDAFLAANARREAFRSEYRLRHKDGQYRWAIDTAAPRLAADGTLLGYIGSVIDITERKQAEEALKEADRRKDEFLATLAHELRNPLAPVRNALQILAVAKDDRQAFERTREIMERQVSQMVRLIDDLLDVSRISQGKLELRLGPTDLASVVYQAVEACRHLYESAGHELTISLPPGSIHLSADVVRLSQVFGNLLHNASKFTDKGGHICLSAERQVDHVAVSVKDNGVGIPPDKIGSVFDMFTQVDKTLERSQGGLGIGLTLVKRLVELHGGTVEARSEGPGRGSEFVVRLPVIDKAPRLPKPVVGEPATNGRRRILIVDDNRDNANSLSLLLELAGNEVHTAHDGVEGIEAARRLQPDVILLDIGMPRLNGYDACRRIREEPWAAKTVIVALTGWGQEADRRKSSEAGFDAHLTKPADPTELQTVLARQRPVPAPTT
jgi:PAS domain S-box-containing protein